MENGQQLGLCRTSFLGEHRQDTFLDFLNRDGYVWLVDDSPVGCLWTGSEHVGPDGNHLEPRWIVHKRQRTVQVPCCPNRPIDPKTMMHTQCCTCPLFRAPCKRLEKRWIFWSLPNTSDAFDVTQFIGTLLV